MEIGKPVREWDIPAPEPVVIPSPAPAEPAKAPTKPDKVPQPA